nr:alpha/beta hydrolase [uncultured Celeribacter sp.]
MALETAAFLLASAGFAGLTAKRAKRRGTAAMQAAPRRGDIVTLPNGQSIHIETHGPVEAPPLVMIHGASGSAYDMTFRIAPALSDRYRLYIVDRPGFGYSSLPEDESLSAQARDIRAAVAQLEQRKPMVLGQSYGGAVALTWALEAECSLSGLVLVSAPSHDWAGVAPLLHRTLATPVLGALGAWLIAAWVPRFVISRELDRVFHPEGAPEGYERHFQPELSLRPATQRVNARQRVQLQRQIQKMEVQYPRLRLPIEAVHGLEDETVYFVIHALGIDRDVKSAHLSALKGVGHMPHHTHPEAVTAAVERLTARVALH